MSGGGPRSVDARLALGAVMAWLLLAWSTGRSPRTAVLVAVVAVAGAAGAMLLRRAPTLALVGCCVAIVLLPAAARVAQARASPLARLARAHTPVTLEVSLDGDPHALSATGPSGVTRMAVDASAVAVHLGARRVSLGGALVVLGPAAPWLGLLPGQRLLVDGRLQPPLDAASTAVGLSTSQPPELLGRPPWWQRAAGRVRSSLRRAAAVLPEPERGLLPGLIDGDTAGLDPVLSDRFRTAGLTHLVAVSGTNCSILLGAVLLVLRRVGARRWVCTVAGLLVLVGFVVVARGSPSVLRAAVMALIALVALASGRPRQAIPALAAAVLGLLLWSPPLAVDAGFTMSVLATGALVAIAPVWAVWLRLRHVPVFVAESLAVAAAAHLVTAPVIAAISGQVSLIAIPANVLAEPVVAAVTVIGFLAALLAPLWLAAGTVMAWLAGLPCRWLVFVADHAGSLGGAALPWPGGLGGGLLLLGVLLVLGVLLRHGGLGRAVAAVVMLAALAQVPLRSVTPGWPPDGWVMVACDVGQGDGLVLPAGPGSAVVVDAGPDPVPMDRCLHGLGVTRIALLALTHFHLDHVGGVLGVLHDRPVGRVLVSPLDEPEEGVSLVRSALAARGVQAEVPAVGASFTVGQTRLDVLGPASAFHGTRSDPNNSSLVLRATVHGVRILLCGDAEVDAQQALLDSGTDLRADVLKVPHHGSAYFDRAFLAAVHARVAVISVGLHNVYGHPAPSLLRELATLGLPVRRTDLDGDVAVLAGAAGLATVTHAPP
ncbi:ComEC/Rec2 family competence protein [Jatrophihabitans sp.]|uniref:ComEC/Rec2 family competence protein n=1 Tax=Jatrophihabitans sp. TaxID=1932789 RepID=UPI0030C7377B|nr:internalization-related competence protein ComEC/Rec2 [Jatrophihabitans sp.]